MIALRESGASPALPRGPPDPQARVTPSCPDPASRLGSRTCCCPRGPARVSHVSHASHLAPCAQRSSFSRHERYSAALNLTLLTLLTLLGKRQVQEAPPSGGGGRVAGTHALRRSPCQAVVARHRQIACQTDVVVASEATPVPLDPVRRLPLGLMVASRLRALGVTDASDAPRSVTPTTTQTL